MCYFVLSHFPIPPISAPRLNNPTGPRSWRRRLSTLARSAPSELKRKAWGNKAAHSKSTYTRDRLSSRSLSSGLLWCFCAIPARHCRLSLVSFAFPIIGFLGNKGVDMLPRTCLTKFSPDEINPPPASSGPNLLPTRLSAFITLETWKEIPSRPCLFFPSILLSLE